MTVPAIAVKRLRTGKGVLDRVRVAADAISLENFIRLLRGADGCRIYLERERVHVPHPGIPFVKIITGDVLVREMAVGASGKMYVCRMEPALVLCIHHVAVVASGRFVPQVGGRVRHPGENTEGEQKGDNPDEEGEFPGHGFHISALHIIYPVFKVEFVTEVTETRNIKQKAKNKNRSAGFVRRLLFTDEVTALLGDHGDQKPDNFTDDSNALVEDIVAENVTSLVIPVAAFTR